VGPAENCSWVWSGSFGAYEPVGAGGSGHGTMRIVRGGSSVVVDLGVVVDFSSVRSSVEITGGPSYLRLVENDIDFGQTDATAVVGHWGKQVWIVGRLEAVVGAEIAAAVELDQD
jgi:hypothetical protein